MSFDQFIDLAALILSILTLILIVKQLGQIGEQIKLQSDQIRLQNYAEYTKRYSEIIFRFPEDINVEDFQLTPTERDDYDSVMRCMRLFFDLSFEEWDLRQRKLISRDTWEIWSGGIATAMNKSAFFQAWKIISADTEYGTDFESFIASLRK